MRLSAVLVTAILMAVPAFAGQAQSSKPAEKLTPPKDAQPADPEGAILPGSLDKIREALQQTPAQALKGLDERPLFRVEIRERQRIDDLLQTMKFNSGPAVPGGLYGFEQQRLMFPSVDNPLAQPWSAFTQPELAKVMAYSAIETMLAKYLAKRIFSSVNAAAERSAREEVTRAIADFCAAQPDHGAGIQICATPPDR